MPRVAHPPVQMLRNQKSNAIGVAPILLACLEKSNVFTKLSIYLAPVIRPEGPRELSPGFARVYPG